MSTSSLLNSIQNITLNGSTLTFTKGDGRTNAQIVLWRYLQKITPRIPFKSASMSNNGMSQKKICEDSHDACRVRRSFSMDWL